jgi:hypothetical protein
MSEDTIDMKSFAGDTKDSAAEGQQIVGQNTYQEETQHEDVIVHKELMEVPKEEIHPPVVEDKTPSEPTRQELNFKALREEIDRVKAEKEEIRANMELMRANVAQLQQPKEPTKEQKMFEGMNKDDIPNVGDIEAAWNRREAEYQSRIEELQIAQKYPDYAEVMEKFTAPLLKQKPHLAEGIIGAKNRALHAYELGKMHQMSQKQEIPVPEVKPPEPSKTAQKIVENARKPGSLSSAGGQGALSKADYFASMSDKEFMEMAAKNLGEI